MTKTHGFYAGSFDPITLGHLDIIKQAVTVFDLVTVGVGFNPKKKRLFNARESADMIKAAVLDHDIDPTRVCVTIFHKSLMRGAAENSATAIVRGLRQVSDFNDEFVLHGVLERTTDLPIVYLICRQEFLHVSSSTAKELASLGEATDWLTTPKVSEALRNAYGRYDT